MPVFAVDKPLGLSSHDVVVRARRILGTRRVGHAGTLDPLASGVLTLLVEDDTKLSPFLTGTDKSYLAWVSFGASTATLDSEGPLLDGTMHTPPDESEIRNALPAFLEMTEQIPPAYSAIKRGGVPAYRNARAGRADELEARPVRFHSVELLGFATDRDELPTAFSPGPQGWLPDESGRRVPLPETLGRFPTALISVKVAAGTYVRSFARDLGESLRVPAFLSGLVRTAAGRIDLSRTVQLEELDEATPVDVLEVLGMPLLELSAEEAKRVRQGQRLPVVLEQRTAFIDSDGQLVAIAETIDGRMSLLRVWS